MLNDKGEVSEKTRKVINKILEKYPDLHFVIATGRTKQGTIPIREALGILNRPNTESLLCNGCIIYDSYGNVSWQNSLPIDYILKFHNLLKSYPNAVHFYTVDNGLITFDEMWAKKAREIIKDNIFIEDREEYIKRVESGESKINKVGYVSVAIDIDSMYC